MKKTEARSGKAFFYCVTVSATVLTVQRRVTHAVGIEHRISFERTFAFAWGPHALRSGAGRQFHDVR
jgi:hypothetical protein